MSRLIIVSNRVAMPGKPKVGGLAVGLSEAARRSQGLWIGWSGKVSDSRHAAVRSGDGYTLVSHDLNAEEHAEFYNGFANRCLWPLLHSRSDLMDYRAEYLQRYQAVNERVADTVAAASRPEDRIWVHDFHFLPLARALRERKVRGAIGLFLHVPFPPVDGLTTLPGHRDLLQSLTAYDLIGFQTEADLQRFRQAMVELLGATATRTGVLVRGQRLALRHLPIGIDCARFEKLACSPTARHESARIAEALGQRQQVIGVDRLDYSKGLTRRARAFASMLEQFPAVRRHVDLLQIAPVSRSDVTAYQQARAQLEQLAAQINGQFGDVDWTPVRYVTRTLSRAHLAGLYRASAAGLVTPLRDGMNLVAKEYIAAQDPADPGVLVLSRFAGAAAQMQAAVLVNPYDPGGTASGLHQALHMSRRERRDRHQELLRGLREQDVHWWAQAFEQALVEASGRRQEAPKRAEEAVDAAA